jgi:hypothetical protein
VLSLNFQSCIGHDLKGLVDAAENYHKVLAENQKLFNEVQELKGNFYFCYTIIVLLALEQILWI